VATWRARLHAKVGTASLKQIQNLEELHLCVSHKLPLSKKTVISHPGRKKERKKERKKSRISSELFHFQILGQYLFFVRKILLI
jgi:hypothetical protein